MAKQTNSHEIASNNIIVEPIPSPLFIVLIVAYIIIISLVKYILNRPHTLAI